MLWNDPTAPRRGWNVLTVFDALEAGPGEPLLDGDHMLLCEACGTQEIRYVHVLEHPNFERAVYVGCDCASRMTGVSEDLLERREGDVRNRSARRATFCGLRNWTQTKKGGWRLRHLGNFYLLSPGRYGGWSVAYKADDERPGAQMIYERGFHHDLDTAKIAVFDAAHPSGRPRHT